MQRPSGRFAKGEDNFTHLIRRGCRGPGDFCESSGCMNSKIIREIKCLSRQGLSINLVAKKLDIPPQKGRPHSDLADVAG